MEELKNLKYLVCYDDEDGNRKVVNDKFTDRTKAESLAIYAKLYHLHGKEVYLVEVDLNTGIENPDYKFTV